MLLIAMLAVSSLSFMIAKPASAQSTPKPSTSNLTSIAHGFSQTFELPQGVYAGIADFNMLVGDHIEGSFSVGNLGPYQTLSGNGTSYEVVVVWIIDPNEPPPVIVPNGQLPSGTVLNFSATPSENSFNFNFTAQEQGTYSMWEFSGAMAWLQNAKNPVMTLSYEWTGTPMKVNILSPLSQIYAESNVSLTYTINRPCDWAGYSLDGANNVTLWDSHNGNLGDGNTTLTGVAIGVHSLTLYTNDSWGNIDSKTVTFTQLTISGNITSAQISNVTIATNQSSKITTLSFMVTGESGTTGFSNITIPKSDVPNGTAPTIYIDNQRASSQGFTQDSSNYYVWYTTSFSTHQVSIVFTRTSSNLLKEALYGAAVAVVIVAIVLVGLYWYIGKARGAKVEYG